MEQRRVGTLPKSLNPATFFREVVAELKKVTWPTRAETIKLTVVVIAISVIVGVFIGGLDALFLAIQSAVFRR